MQIIEKINYAILLSLKFFPKYLSSKTLKNYYVHLISR